MDAERRHGAYLSASTDELYWLFPDGVTVPLDIFTDDDWREALGILDDDEL